MNIRIPKLQYEKILTENQMGYRIFKVLGDYLETSESEITSVSPELAEELFIKMYPNPQHRSKIPPDLIAALPNEILTEDMLLLARIMQYSILSANLDTSPSVYVLGESFQKDLMSANIKGLRIRDIILNDHGYIRIPIPFIGPGGEDLHNIYFLIGDKDLTFAAVSDDFVGKFIMRIPIEADTLDTDLMEYFETQMSEAQEGDHETSTSRTFMLNVAKIFAYINSGQPDVRTFKNIITRKPGGKKYNREIKNLSKAEVKLVGYNWKKQIEFHYTKNTWGVKTHFRWQRYGTGLEKVKLIMIDGHVKSRDKNKIKENPQCPSTF